MHYLQCNLHIWWLLDNATAKHVLFPSCVWGHSTFQHMILPCIPPISLCYRVKFGNSDVVLVFRCNISNPSSADISINNIFITVIYGNFDIHTILFSPTSSGPSTFKYAYLNWAGSLQSSTLGLFVRVFSLVCATFIGASLSLTACSTSRMFCSMLAISSVVCKRKQREKMVKTENLRINKALQVFKLPLHHWKLVCLFV